MISLAAGIVIALLGLAVPGLRWFTTTRGSSASPFPGWCTSC